jgi:uncharacterized delta-60 repeat protein
MRRSSGAGAAVLLLFLVIQAAGASMASAGPGDLDSSFGGDGKVLTTFGPSGDPASAASEAIAVQPDGKVVAAGGAIASDGDRAFALARYNVNGSLDDTFGGDGRVRTNFMDLAFASDVAIQSDGKIVAVGEISDPATHHTLYALARYNVDGSLDDTFGGDGRVTTKFGPAGRALAVAIQSDGKIVVGGSAFRNGKAVFGLIRYDTDGRLDPTFGTRDGRLKGPAGELQDIALEPDDEIVAAGSRQISSPTFDLGFEVARFTADGALDPTFGTDGRTRTRFGSFSHGSDASAAALALVPGGRIVVAGEFHDEDANGNPVRGFALAAYHANGSADRSFGGDGKVETRFGRNSGAFGVAIQPDGKIVAAGIVADLTDVVPSRFAVIRYLTDGSLDGSFGRDGKRKTRIGSQPTANDVALQPDGGITLAGDAGNFPDRFALVRYLAA